MQEIKLPFAEALKRSFSFVFNHMEVFWKISLLWGVLLTLIEALEGFPSLCLTEECSNQQRFPVSMWFTLLAGVSIMISYITYVIKRTEYKSFFNLRLDKRDLKYLWAAVKLIVAAVVIAFVSSLILGIIGKFLGLALEKSTFILLFMLSLCVVLFFFMRYTLVFPAIALENSEIGFEKSYALTKGNINSIFWGSFFISLPIILMNLFIVSFYMALGKNIYIDFIFSFILCMLGFINIALKASFFAHIYQYFIYFYEKSQTKEKAE